MESTALMTKTFSLLTATERETAAVQDNRLGCNIHRSEDLVIVENITFTGAQWFEAARVQGDCFEVTVRVTEREPVKFSVPEWWVNNWVQDADQRYIQYFARRQAAFV